jgi:hypothetical protein
MNPSDEKKVRAKKEAQWRRSADLVRSMVFHDQWAPSVGCPFCYDNSSGDDHGIPHMLETVFGAVEGSTSGPGLIIKFECEEGHRWQLRLIDHSGGTWLSVS